jgi:DNA helicase II / ATP-dependent DNA helicase PcrA
MEAGQKSREQLHKQFRKLLGELNTEQRRAAEHIEGPALVLAGPGTGKTHLVVTRIANILLETDTPAQSILCLTYSDAGATALRKRLVKMIGSDAYKISVFTFHAFCSRVMNEHPELFGRGREMQLMSELEKSQWMDDLLRDLVPGHLYTKRYKSLYNLRGKLAHLFGVMKREKWSVSEMRTKIAEYKVQMPSDPEFLYKVKSGLNKRGDIKRAAFDDMLERMDLLDAGVQLYDVWQNVIAENHRYEYDDMVGWVIDAMEKHPHLKLQLQERYLYLVVDEYQDTNAAQNQIIRLLTDYWEVPNVFIVGDDDQSIYEFQGARLHNLVDFYRDYEPVLEAVVLEKNYRSTQAILDAAKRVIDYNELRALPLLKLAGSKTLVASSGKNWPEQPELRVFQDEFSELVWVLDEIERQIAAGTSPDEIAVIYRNNKHGERVATLMRERGIPFTAKKEVSVLDLSLIQQIVKLIEWVSAELRAPFESEGLLFAQLHAPYWNLKPLDLALLLAHRRTKEEEQRLRVLLHDSNFLAQSGARNRENITRAAEALEVLIAQAATMPILRFWNQLLNSAGILKWCLEQPDSVYWTQVVHTFTAWLEEEVRRMPSLSLGQVPSLIRSMHDLRLKVPLIQVAQTDNGVRLLTAHGSKGLEYETVFLIHCTKSSWIDGMSGSKNQFTLPSNITLSGEEDSLEAQRRLFYVAMTRAKRRLYLSFARRDLKLKDQQPAQFVTETELLEIDQLVEKEATGMAQILVMGQEREVIADIPKDELIRAFVENYTLSLSGLNQYLDCPLSFYYEKILRLPGVTSDAANFGTVIHSALDLYFQKRNAAKTPESVQWKQLQDIFKQEMARFQLSFSSPADYRHKLEYGLNCLEGYYTENSPSWTHKSRQEVKLDRLTIDGVPVTGVIDRIDVLSPDHVRLVDYKSGVIDNKDCAPPSEKAEFGGKYYRQGLFYKLMADASTTVPGTVSEVVFSFTEPNAKRKYQNNTINIDDDATQWMRTLVRTKYAEIQAQKFENGCGKPECAYCSMHITGQLDENRLDDVFALDDES